MLHVYWGKKPSTLDGVLRKKTSTDENNIISTTGLSMYLYSSCPSNSNGPNYLVIFKNNIQTNNWKTFEFHMQLSLKHFIYILKYRK